MNRDAGTAASALVLTGERTLPGIWHENYWFRRHEAAYVALLPFVTAKRVAELGCGEGYGAALLATRARTVVAVELEAPVAQHVRRTHHQVRVVRGDLQRLPLADGAVEVAACLQTIEHLWNQPQFVRECARVLIDSGTYLVTTPNTLTFPKGNIFHTRELDLAELVELLEPHFTVTHPWGLRHGERLGTWEQEHGSLVDHLIERPWQEWSTELADLVRSVTVDDFDVGPADAADLDLVVVATRR